MRNRILKEGFFRNYDLACLPPLARLLFQGLWCMADKEGRLVDQPPRIKAEILPYDDCDVTPLLDALHTSGFIARYEVSGRRYIQVINFTKHQALTTYEKTQTTSEIPPPPVENTSDRPAEPDRSTSEVLQNNFGSKSERRVREYSAEAGGAPRAPNIFDVGVPLLTRGGVMTDRNARGLLGRLAKQYGNEAVATAIAVTSMQPRANTHEYLVASRDERRQREAG
jgi:hypothetical protein